MSRVCRFSPAPSNARNPCSPDNPFGKLVNQKPVFLSSQVQEEPVRVGSAEDSDHKKYIYNIKNKGNLMRQSYGQLPNVPIMHQSSSKDDDVTPPPRESLLSPSGDDYNSRPVRLKQEETSGAISPITRRSIESGPGARNQSLISQTGVYSSGGQGRSPSASRLSTAPAGTRRAQPTSAVNKNSPPDPRSSSRNARRTSGSGSASPSRDAADEVDLSRPWICKHSSCNMENEPDAPFCYYCKHTYEYSDMELSI
jgi:hypothetical protein